MAPNTVYKVECSYSASFDDENSWKKGEETIPPAASESSAPAGVSVVSTTHLRTLVFNPFTIDHVGEYECFFPGGSRKLQIEDSKCIQKNARKQIIPPKFAHSVSNYDVLFCHFFFTGNPTIVLEYVDLVFVDNAFISDFRTHKPLQSGDIPQGAELQWYKDGEQQDLQAGLLVLDNHAKPSQAGVYTARLVDSNDEILVSENMTITVNSEFDASFCTLPSCRVEAVAILAASLKCMLF